jgi:hypothetical protein
MEQNVDFKCPFAEYRCRLGKKMKKENSRTYRRARYGRFYTPETHNKWSLRASSTGELIFDNVKYQKKICYQTNLVWGTTWMFRFSTLRNRLGAMVLLWIVMTLHFVMLKTIQFDKTCRYSITAKEISRNDYRNHKSTIANIDWVF